VIVESSLPARTSAKGIPPAAECFLRPSSKSDARDIDCRLPPVAKRAPIRYPGGKVAVPPGPCQRKKTHPATAIAKWVLYLGKGVGCGREDDVIRT